MTELQQDYERRYHRGGYSIDELIEALRRRARSYLRKGQAAPRDVLDELERLQKLKASGGGSTDEASGGQAQALQDESAPALVDKRGPGWRRRVHEKRQQAKTDQQLQEDAEERYHRGGYSTDHLIAALQRRADEYASRGEAIPDDVAGELQRLQKLKASRAAGEPEPGEGQVVSHPTPELLEGEFRVPLPREEPEEPEALDEQPLDQGPLPADTDIVKKTGPGWRRRVRRKMGEAAGGGAAGMENDYDRWMKEEAEAGREKKTLRVTPAQASRLGRAAWAFDPGHALPESGERTKAGMGIGPVESSGPMVKAKRAAQKLKYTKDAMEQLGLPVPEQLQTEDERQAAAERQFGRQLGQDVRRARAMSGVQAEAAAGERAARKAEEIVTAQQAMDFMQTVDLGEDATAGALQTQMQRLWEDREQIERYVGHGAMPADAKKKLGEIDRGLVRAGQLLKKRHDEALALEQAEQEAAVKQRKEEADQRKAEREDANIKNRVADLVKRAQDRRDRAEQEAVKLDIMRVEAESQIQTLRAGMAELEAAIPQANKGETEAAYKQRLAGDKNAMARQSALQQIAAAEAKVKTLDKYLNGALGRQQAAEAELSRAEAAERRAWGEEAAPTPGGGTPAGGGEPTGLETMTDAELMGFARANVNNPEELERAKREARRRLGNAGQ